MTEITVGTLTIPAWSFVGGIVLVSTCLLLVIKSFILTRLVRITDHTSFRIDSLLVSAARFPLTVAILVGNLWLLDFLLQLYEISSGTLSGRVELVAQLLLIVAILIFIDRALEGFMLLKAENSDTLRSSLGILTGVARGIIVGLGVLMILGTLGISITPIVASLGITSLAVALALQPTLENFFSGVQLVADKPIRVGDFIELDSGEQGFVEKIGWRSTWIRMLPNNTVIMPNSLLSQSKIINYFYPSKELSVPVEVGVHYSSDLEHVERVTLEVAREILEQHEWGVSEYETFVVYHTFDSSSINFTVMLRAQEYFQRFWVKSAFIKALHQRFNEEGIVIPFPIRAINTIQESDGADQKVV